MTNEELLEGMYETTAAKVGLIGRVFFSLYFLITALVAGKRKEYDKALYKAAVWGISSHNNLTDLKFRYRTLQDGHGGKGLQKKTSGGRLSPLG